MIFLGNREGFMVVPGARAMLHKAQVIELSSTREMTPHSMNSVDNG